MYHTDLFITTLLLQCHYLYQFGVVSTDGHTVNLLNFYLIVSWIASDQPHNKLGPEVNNNTIISKLVKQCPM